MTFDSIQVWDLFVKNDTTDMSVYDDKVASETIQLNQMHIESSIIVPLKIFHG